MIELLPTEFWAFVKQHSGADVGALALKFAKKTLPFPLDLALVQIRARQKAKGKLDVWLQVPNLFFPNTLCTEQCSSERTAQWKAAQIKGKVLIDLTGGLGVDAWAFSKRFEKVIYVEKDEALCAAAKHNFKLLDTLNIEVHCAESTEFLKERKEKSDCIFLDPARRDDVGKKVFRLEDCSPDIVKLLPELREKTKTVLLKAAPFLDIKQAISQLDSVQNATVLGAGNEVKELLFFLDFQKKKPTEEMQAVRLMKNGEDMSFGFSSTQHTEKQATTYSYPKRYIYEPDAVLMKLGKFAEYAERYGLDELHPNTHLFTSDEWKEDFMGRAFELKAVCPYSKKIVAQFLESKKANVSTRNFPESPEQMKKKLGVKDGGPFYLMGVTLMDGQLAVLVLRKKERADVG